jgi:outer membrane protein assembly factor BamB
MKLITVLWGVIMAALYTQVFADDCHSNYLDARTSAAGKVAWSKPISGNAGKKADAGLIILSDSHIIACGVKQFCAFDKHGKRLWERDKWSGSPVALREGLIYYTSPSGKNLMEAVDGNNAVRIKDFKMPLVGDTSYLVLFEPFNEGVIAQVRNAGLPEQGGDSFAVYKIRKGGLSFDWSRMYENENSAVLPMACPKASILVTSTQKEALVFDINAKARKAEPISRFPLPLGKSTLWVSFGLDRQLYWSGVKGRQTTLVVTDTHGKEKWHWGIDAQPAGPAFPPILAPDRVYILSRRSLAAVQNGRELWEHQARSGNFSAGTALADSSVLVVEGKKLLHLDARGKVLFEVTLHEAIAAPPVVDGDGNIYVASPETLYSIH